MTEPICSCIKYILFPNEIMDLANRHQWQPKPLCKKLMRNFIMDDQTDNCWTHRSILASQKEGKPDVMNLPPIQCERKYTVPPRKYFCKTTEPEPAHASRATHQHPEKHGDRGMYEMMPQECNRQNPEHETFQGTNDCFLSNSKEKTKRQEQKKRRVTNRLRETSETRGPHCFDPVSEKSVVKDIFVGRENLNARYLMKLRSFCSSFRTIKVLWKCFVLFF